jgi:hypothetical protein
MLTALALAAATVIPPISVSVRAAPNLPRAMVVQTLEEAAAIWRAADVTFAWRIVDGTSDEHAIVTAVLSRITSLRVTIDEDPGPERDRGLPIGWIIFDGAGSPTPDIHLSYANAMTLIRASEGAAVVGRMTVMELRTYLSRALGRALAHEMGHYLLASKAHTPDGLMRGSRPASEFLGAHRDGFQIAPALKAAVGSQMRLAESMARR